MINFRQLLGFLLLSAALCQPAWTSQNYEDTIPPTSSITSKTLSPQEPPAKLPSTTASSMCQDITVLPSLGSTTSNRLSYSEKQKKTPLEDKNFLDLPLELQNLILIKTVYTNPWVICVCRKFRLALYEESESIRYIFNLSRSTNSPHIFKTGFKGLVFNNDTCPEKDCLEVHKCLRGFLKEASSFPEELKENMPTGGFPKGEVTWDYLTVFKLVHRQLDYPFSLLKQMKTFLKTLETYSNDPNANNNDPTSKVATAFISGKSLNSFITGSSFPSNLDQDFTEFYKEINVTYKLILLKHQKLNAFLDAPTSLKVLKLMQNAPIGASLLSPSASQQNEDLKKAIDTSLEKLRTLLTRLAQKRWEIVRELDLYLKVG